MFECVQNKKNNVGLLREGLILLYAGKPEIQSPQQIHLHL